MKRQVTRKSGAKKNVGKRRRRGFPIKSLRMILTIFVLFVMIVTAVFTVLIYILLDKIFPELAEYATSTVVASLLASSIIGTGLAAIISKWFLHPLKEMINATNKISRGDFKVQLKENFDESTEVGMLQRSFNHMARELDGIEMFRKDFINNFSHEFKTPLVSIKGLVGLMKNKDLPKEKQLEYLDIIEDEVNRLSLMTTTVLSLSRLENQGILTGL